MTDINKRIIELIKQNKSMKEICFLLGMSEKQLYIRIKQIIKYGYQLIPSYSYNSDIYYKIETGFINYKKKEFSIKMSNSIKEFRCIVISDAHICNSSANIELLNIVFNYAVKNDINVILMCGDMLEGIHSTAKTTTNDIYKQISEFIKKYPYDRNIKTYGILGNHEYHFLHYDGLDVLKTIMDARYDIVLLGYGDGIINIKNDSLLLHHNLSIIKNKEIKNIPKIILDGHGHMMKSKFYDQLILRVPSISSVSSDKNKEVIPGFIDMTIQLEKGYFEFLEAHHMIITPKIYEASETKCRIKNINNSFNKGKY